MNRLPGERIDELFRNGYRIIQHEAEFSFSLDAVLAAHFAYVKPGMKALDLGTGTGVIAMLLASRGVDKIAGIEMNSRMASLAKRSVALNKLQERIDIVEGDYRKPQAFLPNLPAGSADLVIANPPYRVIGSGEQNASVQVASARHELNASLEDVLAAAAFWVKYRGRFVMVHLPERLTEILTLMRKKNLEPKRLRLVHPLPHKEANILLVEGVRGGKPGLRVMAPLIVHKKDGSYAEEVMSYYGSREVTV